MNSLEYECLMFCNNLIIMKPAFYNQNFIFFYLVNQSVLPVNPSAPESLIFKS